MTQESPPLYDLLFSERASGSRLAAAFALVQPGVP